MTAIAEFLLAVSGTIAATVQGLGQGGAVHTFTALALIAVGGLIAGVSPSGLTAGLPVLGQLQSIGRDSNPNHGMMVTTSFALGMLTALGTLGVLTAWAGQIVVSLAKWLPLLTLLMGLNMLGVIRWKWFRSLKGVGSPASGPVDAFVLGLPFGVATSPCALPVLITVLTVAAVKGNAGFALGGLLAFGVGRSIPICLLGLCNDQARAVPQIQRAAPYLRPLAGAVIVVVSLYFLTFGRALLG